MAGDAAAPDALTVSEFIGAAKARIEGDAEPVWVVGEVANFTRAASGHWYFSLRDDAGRLDCVMLVRQNRLVESSGDMPKDGDRVLVFGGAALYAPQARFQLAVRFMRFDGAGRLHQLFLQRKEAWRKQGWFDNARPLPRFPRAVGVVCSSAGAALHDVLHVLAARYPLARVILHPAPAQGAGAAEKIAAMIDVASGFAKGGKGGEGGAKCDVLLVVRGGGSLEDLWAYNEEAVVTAIHRCAIPVISGIGHETDHTLADYAADMHCPTPTAAAVAAVPAAARLHEQMDEAAARLRHPLQQALDSHSQQLDWAQRLLTAPQRLLAEKAAAQRALQQALAAAAGRQWAAARGRLRLAVARLPLPEVRLPAAALAAAAGQLRRAVKTALVIKPEMLEKRARALELLSPDNLLRRGYSIVTTPGGEVVGESRRARREEKLKLRFSDGTVWAKPLDDDS